MPREQSQADAKVYQTPRDPLSDCPACVVDELVVYLRFRNQNLRAVTEGIALLDKTFPVRKFPMSPTACCSCRS